MRKSKGFTLIEMLIVIAVIGVLAIAVLSAINPVEQMRKARDTRRRSSAAELLNALERYYATHEEYPSDYSASAADTDTCLGAIGNLVSTDDLVLLIANRELKPEFSDRIADVNTSVYGALELSGDTDLAMVCYEIESESNKDKYTGEDNYCEGGTDQEYVCLPE